MVGEAQPWRIVGTYLEACNCEAICPCRRIGGRQGGRSTYGVCMGALSWAIEEGEVAGVDVAGLRVVIACTYDDDEEGSPWDIHLYIDERAGAPQHDALESVFLGRLGGTQFEHFPWVWKPSRLHGVHSASIELEHAPRRGWFRAGRDVTVRVGSEVDDQEPVTCVIPGHERTGHELYSDEIDVTAEPLDFSFSGRCAYWSTFEYGSEA